MNDDLSKDEKKLLDSNDDITPDDALRIITTAAKSLQQIWLNNALNLASNMESGINISPGMFDDIQRSREQFEELERARLILSNMIQDQDVDSK